jgi:hypothetical protein
MELAIPGHHHNHEPPGCLSPDLVGNGERAINAVFSPGSGRPRFSCIRLPQMEATMRTEHSENSRSGLKQVFWAWIVLLVLATMFRVTDLVWPSQPTSFVMQATNAALVSDSDQGDEPEEWVRGETCKSPSMLSAPHRNLLASSAGQ